MPEGDTIHRAARRLARALEGKTVTRFESSIPDIAVAGLLGKRIQGVDAHGKYMSIRFDDGRVLVSHMRMNGSWHLYKERERWWRPERMARVVIGVEAVRGDEALVAVCFSAPIVRLIHERQDHLERRRLGPDVVADAWDAREAVARLRRSGGDRAIGDAILDQHGVSGVGNIYKSEVLFAERVDPFARVSALSDDVLASVVARARALMRINLAPSTSMRTTTSGLVSTRFAVYRRGGKPCLRCSQPIVRAVQGQHKRSTYFCPYCQVSTPGRACDSTPF